MSKNSVKKLPDSFKPQKRVGAVDTTTEGKCRGVAVHPNGNGWREIDRHWNLCMDCDPRVWIWEVMAWVKKKNYRPTDPSFFRAIANALEKSDHRGYPVFELEVPKVHLADPGVSVFMWKHLPLRQRILIMEQHGDKLLPIIENRAPSGDLLHIKAPRYAEFAKFVRIHGMVKMGRSKSNYVDAFMDVLDIVEVTGV